MGTSQNHSPAVTPGSLVEDGEAFYKEHLKATLEPDHLGQFVAIEPNTGRYFLGHTATVALVAAENAIPDCQVFLTRIGRNPTHKNDPRSNTKGH